MHKLLNDMESTDSSFFLYEEFVWEGLVRKQYPVRIHGR